MTYTLPEIKPRIAPNKMERSNMATGPRLLLIVICALNTDDNSAIEPIEKSNLPELRLIDKAKATSTTLVIARKNIVQLNLESNNDIPFKLAIKRHTIKTVTGITNVPNNFFPYFIKLLRS